MIDFLKYRYITAMVSLVIIGGTVGLAAYRYVNNGQVFNYSIDFTEGTQVQLHFSSKVTTEEIKSIVEKAGWPGAISRGFSDQDVLVRVKQVSTTSESLAEEIRTKVAAALPGNEVTVAQSESVGPGVGEEMRTKVVWCILLALLAMLLYIAFTFWSLAFATGAVVSLFHDAVVMIGVYLLLNREVSLNFIAAVATVLGYSINDTIVIFSQIRQNLKTMRGAPLADVVNLSINQTLRRTMLTTLSTALVVVTMFVLGGEALRDLSMSLLVGIVFGVYSTIYIASPVMMLLYKEKEQA